MNYTLSLVNVTVNFSLANLALQLTDLSFFLSHVNESSMSNGFLPIYLNALFCTYHYQKYNVNSTQFDWIRY